MSSKFVSDGPVILEPTTEAILGYVVFAYGLGGIMNGTLMAAIIRQKKTLSHGNILLLNMIFADLIQSILTAAFNSISFANQSNSLSRPMCQFSGSLCKKFRPNTVHSIHMFRKYDVALAVEVVIVFTMLFNAFYQYNCVVLRSPMFKDVTFYRCIGLIWGFSLFVSTLPSILPTFLVDEHSMRSFGGVCLPPPNTRKPVSMALESLALFVLFMTPLLLIFMYLQIWNKIKSTRGKIERPNSKVGARHTESISVVSMNDIDTQTGPGLKADKTSFPVTRFISRISLPSSKSTKRLDIRVEKAFLLRAVTVSSIYLVLFFPVAVIWAIELVQNINLPYIYEGAALCLVATNTYMNPLVLIIIDRPYRKAISQLFGFHLDERQETSSSGVVSGGAKSYKSNPYDIRAAIQSHKITEEEERDNDT